MALWPGTGLVFDPPRWSPGSHHQHVLTIYYESSHESEGMWYTGPTTNKGKVVYNPLRLGTVIALVSSGIDFVNTPRFYSDRASR